MNVGILVFPGSNCDADCHHVIQNVMGAKARFVWHKDTSLKGLDAVVIPGGFSYGDYLRCGAIAKFSPIMKEVVLFAKKGGPILGICNGFQILVEASLLPGVLMKNAQLQFICDEVHLKLVNTETVFTRKGRKEKTYQMPIAHMEGNYFIDPEGLAELETNNQLVFQYVDGRGQLSAKANPNGSLKNIAGICNKEGNILGMMPHPERVSEGILGSEDGRFIFESMLG